MDILDGRGIVNRAEKYLLPVLFVISLVSVSFASTQMTSALYTLCTISQTFLGAAVMVLIVLAGVTYAIGQILGAETRARATVWATAMLTGAIIGAIIYIIAPIIINALLGSSAHMYFDPNNPCAGMVEPPP